MFGMSMDIGVDLGTATVLVYIKGKGIVLREPSVVAIDRDTNRIIAIGEEARRMLGRTPGNIVAIRPLREGVIADYDTTESMLRHFIEKVAGRSMFFKPRIMVCVPSGVTTVEKRAVLEAAMQAGARKTFLIEEPLAAALGAGLVISEPCGSMVVDIGGGTTDVAVLSLGGIVVSESLRVGGDKFDEALVRYIKKEYNIMIGERTAEEIKVNVGTAYPSGRNESMEIRPAEDYAHRLGRNARGPGRAHFPHHRVRQDGAGEDPSRTGGRHRRPRHRHDRWRLAPPRTGQADQPGDRHTHLSGRRPAVLRGPGHGQSAGIARSAAGFAHDDQKGEYRVEIRRLTGKPGQPLLFFAFSTTFLAENT